MTNWAAWQIGYETIWFCVSEEDAIIFSLLWPKENNS